MLPESVRNLATSAYTVRLNDESTAFAVQLRNFQAQLAANGIVGNAGATGPFDFAGQSIRKRCLMAAEELQRACESNGVPSSGHLARDLKDAWGAMTLARGWDDIRKRAMDAAIPHTDSDHIDKLWQITSVVTTNDGKAEADALLDHFAMQLARDRSRAWRDRFIAGGSGAAGFALGHAADIVRWVAGVVHR
jgi:hypothetical protein